MLRLIAALVILIAANLPASARTIQIVACGDSATAGWLVAHQDAYPAQLQAALRKKGYDVTVANAGVNGDTTADALKRFDSARSRPVPISPSSSSAPTICVAAFQRKPCGPV